MSEELIIPVRMDSSRARQELSKLGQEGKETGSEVARGVNQARDALGRFQSSADGAATAMHGVGGAAKSAGSELAGFLKLQVGVQAFSRLAGTLSDQFRQTAEEIGRASKEWQSFRASLQGVSSLSGQQNSNTFAEGEVARAERAKVWSAGRPRAPPRAPPRASWPSARILKGRARPTSKPRSR